jgi:hypothetical protein
MHHNEQIASAVQCARSLYDIDWGDWTLAALERVVDTRPGWTLTKWDGPVSIETDIAGGELVAYTGKYGWTATRYATARLMLPASLCEPEAFAALVEALKKIGSPVPHRGTSAGPGLRWRDRQRVMILQRNRRDVWLAIHPACDSPAGEVAAAFHDRAGATWTINEVRALAETRPGWQFDGELLRVGGSEFLWAAGEIRLIAYQTESSSEARIAAFGELFDAVVGNIGDPTVYGGSASGPDVRWRNDDRLLVLRGDDRGVWLVSRSTAEVEHEEFGIFEHHGPASTTEQFPDYLPYIWQLFRDGPGEQAYEWPALPKALSLEHFRDALEPLLAAFVSQLPTVVGKGWASFEIRKRADDGVLRVIFNLINGDGLTVSARHRTYADANSTAVMRARGWQRCDDSGTWWETGFPDPGHESAAKVARLIVHELHAWGAVEPEKDLYVEDVSCDDEGSFHLPGLGI